MPTVTLTPVLVLLLLLLHLPDTLLSQTLTPTPPPNQHIVSTASPLTAYFSTHPHDLAAIKPLHALLQTLSNVIDTRAKNSSPLACNLRAVAWLPPAEALLKSTRLLGLDETCRTRVDATSAALAKELTPSLLASAQANIRTAATAHAVAARSFVDSFQHWSPTVDWTQGVFPITGWDIRRRAQTCRVESTVAIRHATHWYIRAAVTSRPVDAFAPDGRRALLEEFVRHDLHDALALPRWRWPDATAEQNGTTVLTLSGGKAGFAAVPMAVDDNPALVEALRLNDGAVDQARDAITPSNVAILALPMAMSLIPVAFVADLSTCATLLYIILTDVLSCLPFLIKGIELVASGSIERGDLVAYHIGSPSLGLMEIWAATCHGDDHFRMLGYIFIAVALVIIVLGMLLEFLASRIMHVRRRRLRGMKVAGGESIGPFGNALLVPSRSEDEGSDDDFVHVFDEEDAEPRRNRIALRLGKLCRPRPVSPSGFDEPFPEPSIEMARFVESGVEDGTGWWSRRRNIQNAQAVARDRSECTSLEGG